ncbi:MAG: hypothetical protein KJN62_00655 [Deltaproteobacteria bacterium]|nr:hypothetical protein [Deltaproteobacteria bacterium]
MSNKARILKTDNKNLKWKAHIKDWREGSLTQAAYCRLHNLPVKSFYYWKKKFDSPVTIVPVKIKHEIFKTSTPLVLTIDSRYRIDVDNGFNHRTLEQIIQVINQI